MRAAAAAFAGIVGTGIAIAATQNRRDYYDSYGYYGGGPAYYAAPPAYYGGGPVYYGGGGYYRQFGRAALSRASPRQLVIANAIKHESTGRLGRWIFFGLSGRPLTRWPRLSIRFRRMSDSLDRLYQAVIAARDLDPATSRTARLFQRGPAKMAKKLAEEAIEVVIDAVNGKTDAVVRESADLLYNLTVLWAAAGVKPEDVWREMERRELMLGIAEKLPKSTVKPPKAVSSKVVAGKAACQGLADRRSPRPRRAESPPSVRRRIVALEGRSLRKRH